MTTKRPHAGASVRRSAADRVPDAAPYNPDALRPSDIPGVWLNRFNIPCDENGVSLSFKAVRAKDRANMAEVLDDVVTTPAGYLRAVALDPRFPTAVRLDAAKAAAPYTDRKQPTALDGGVAPDGSSIPLLDLSKLGGLSTEELVALRGLLAKAGVPE